MAVLQFKFDESYDSQIMSVGGWIGDESEWRKLESAWQKRIDFENAHNRADQQITRFHATEMNCKDYEYQNWDKNMCLQFSKKLVHMLANRKMGALAVACDMDALSEVFSKGDNAELKRRTYTLCFKALMVDIAHLTRAYFPGDTVLLIHDHGSWDAEALLAYDLMIEEDGKEPERIWGRANYLRDYWLRPVENRSAYKRLTCSLMKLSKELKPEPKTPKPLCMALFKKW